MMPSKNNPATILLVVLAFVSVDDILAACQRTWNNREHLHPKVRGPLPILTDDQAAELQSYPSELDWCTRGFCTPSWNQHIPQYCGSCFLHGSLSAAQDRIAIMNHRRGYTGPNVMLGRQTFLNCAPGHGMSQGCGGGEPAEVFEFMKDYGLPDESCLPYNATDNTKFGDTAGMCPPEGYCMNCFYTPDSPRVPHCFPVKKVVRYRAKEYGHLSGEYAIIKELQNGPITCGIACSPEFDYNYTSGIFEDKTNYMDVDHDVEIVGYGEADGVKYWHIRNSWGTYWGMNGFFKIRRGINNLAIESDCSYMVPDVTDEELVWGEHPTYGGSGWGLKPITKNANSLVVMSTDDVTGELAAAEQKYVTNTIIAAAKDTHSMISSFTVVVAAAVGVAIGLFVGSKRRERTTYDVVN